MDWPAERPVERDVADIPAVLAERPVHAQVDERRVARRCARCERQQCNRSDSHDDSAADERPRCRKTSFEPWPTHVPQQLRDRNSPHPLPSLPAYNAIRRYYAVSGVSLRRYPSARRPSRASVWAAGGRISRSKLKLSIAPSRIAVTYTTLDPVPFYRSHSGQQNRYLAEISEPERPPLAGNRVRAVRGGMQGGARSEVRRRALRCRRRPRIAP